MLAVVEELLARDLVERSVAEPRSEQPCGGRVNVELCRTTGEFFRTWGLPGSRFTPTSEPAEASET